MPNMNNHEYILFVKNIIFFVKFHRKYLKYNKNYIKIPTPSSDQYCLQKEPPARRNQVEGLGG